MRDPAYIGKGTKIINSYIGSFTTIGIAVKITDSEIENSVILVNVKIRCVYLIDSLIGINLTIEKRRKTVETRHR